MTKVYEEILRSRVSEMIEQLEKKRVKNVSYPSIHGHTKRGQDPEEVSCEKTNVY